MEKENPIYDAYKEQSSSRQKYWLAGVCLVCGIVIGYLICML